MDEYKLTDSKGQCIDRGTNYGKVKSHLIGLADGDYYLWYGDTLDNKILKRGGKCKFLENVAEIGYYDAWKRWIVLLEDELNCCLDYLHTLPDGEFFIHWEGMKIPVERREGVTYPKWMDEELRL